MAAGGRTDPLSLEDIDRAVQRVAPGKVLPTAVLSGLSAGSDTRVLVYLLKCRATGFLVLLPALAEVQEILESLQDAEGNPLVVSKDFSVALEDARGRKFGHGDMLMADFAADCCSSFYRAPVLRGAAQQGLLRLMVGAAVARPASRSALALAAEWIAEMAEADEAILEYFTAEDPGDSELVPDGAGGLSSSHPEPGLGGVDHDVVQQLQNRIAELERQVAPASPQMPVVDLEPRPHGPGRSVLFEPTALTTALPSGTLQRLKELAGPPPQRLGKLENAVNPPAASNEQHMFADAEAGAVAEDEFAQLLNSAKDPLHQLLAMQMKQTAAIVQRLTPSKDPISAALGNDAASSSGGGVKGCVARDAYLRAMEDVKTTGKLIAQNAAQDLGLPQDQINSGLMRMYVERRMPLGDQRLLTYMSQFLAVGWQLSYEARDQFAMGLMARGLMMTEQMSIDSGRCQFGWLLAAMPDPNLQAISMNKRRIGLTPYTKLAAAPWIAGNIAYLRDLDYLESRLKNPKGEKAEKEASTEDTSGPKKPWKPKKRANQKGGGKEDSTESTA